MMAGQKDQLSVIQENTLTIREKVVFFALLAIIKLFQTDEWSRKLTSEIDEIKKVLGVK